MAPLFIEAGLKVNTTQYLKIGLEVFSRCSRKNYDPKMGQWVKKSACMGQEK